MAFRLVRGGGINIDAAAISIRASGTVRPGAVVEFSRTGGVGVFPASSTSTTTNIFGVCLDYVQGASDMEAKVIPFAPGQLWEVDCANSASTAQIGLRHELSALAANRGFILHNTATDLGAGNAHTAFFKAIAMVGGTSGSGKLLGIIRTQESPVPTTDTTFV